MWDSIAAWTNTILEAAILYILVKEYNYDYQKDVEKKQKRTKTTKKTTTQPGGPSTVEETTETVESTGAPHEAVLNK